MLCSQTAFETYSLTKFPCGHLLLTVELMLELVSEEQRASATRYPQEQGSRQDDSELVWEGQKVSATTRFRSDPKDLGAY